MIRFNKYYYHNDGRIEVDYNCNDGYERLENELIISLDNNTKVLQLDFDNERKVVTLNLDEKNKMIHFYIFLDDKASEEEVIKVNKLLLDYYREVML